MTNPYSVTYVGNYDTSGTAGAYDVYVSGKYAYVADDDSGLQIIDVSTPSEPTRVGTYDTTGNARWVYVVGKYAYIADATAGLTIVDVSTPASPTYVGNYTPGSSPTAYNVYVSGRYAYLADGASGVQIIDVSNPASPTKTGTYDTTGTAYNVYGFSKYFAVADRDSGLTIVNVSTPASPVYVANYDTSGSAYSARVVGKYAWVADGTAGLTAINIGGADLSTVDAGNVTTGNLNVTESTDIGQNLFVRGTLNVGIQGILSDGPISASNLQAVSTTTPQLTLKYDNTNYVTLAVSSAGLVTLDTNGAGAAFKFSDNVTFSGTAAGDATNYGGTYAYIGYGQTGAASVNTYIPMHSGYVPVAGTGFNCIGPMSTTGIHVAVNTAPGAGNGARYEIYKGGVATGLYCDLTTTNKECETTSAIAAKTCTTGDHMQVYVKTDGADSFASGTDITVTIEITS